MSAEEGNFFNEDTARRLWEECRLRVANAEPGETIDFSDMEFSDDPADQYFHEVEFHATADFTGSVFQTGGVFRKAIFHGYAIFNNTVFKEKDDFLSVVFEDKVSFDEAIFSRAVGFHSNFQRDVSFESAVFLSDALFGHPTDSLFKNLGRLKFDSSVSFDNAKFKGAASFDNLDFDGNVSFESTLFYYWAEFNGLKFNSNVSFEDAHFQKDPSSRDSRRNLVRFQDVEFKEKVSFKNCIVECNAIFTRNIFEDEADLRKIKFKRESRFSHNIFKFRLRLDKQYKTSFSRAEDAILPYRQAKITAGQQGDSYWQGQFHYQEHCAEDANNRTTATLNPMTKTFWKFKSNLLYLWLEALVGRWIFGYGEKPLRPLMTGAVVIVLWAILFLSIGGIDKSGCIDSDNCSIWSCLYFSTVTFTTLGYGDIKPQPGLARLLSSSEAVLGAALMALFIVSLSRKFVR